MGKLRTWPLLFSRGDVIQVWPREKGKVEGGKVISRRRWWRTALQMTHSEVRLPGFTSNVFCGHIASSLFPIMFFNFVNMIIQSITKNTYLYSHHSKIAHHRQTLCNLSTLHAFILQNQDHTLPFVLQPTSSKPIVIFFILRNFETRTNLTKKIVQLTIILWHGLKVSLYRNSKPQSFHDPKCCSPFLDKHYHKFGTHTSMFHTSWNMYVNCELHITALPVQKASHSVNPE